MRGNIVDLKNIENLIKSTVLVQVHKNNISLFKIIAKSLTYTSTVAPECFFWK